MRFSGMLSDSKHIYHAYEQHTHTVPNQGKHTIVCQHFFSKFVRAKKKKRRNGKKRAKNNVIN